MPPRLLRTLPGHAGAETGEGTEVVTCGARPLMGDRGLRLPAKGRRPKRCVGGGVYFSIGKYSLAFLARGRPPPTGGHIHARAHLSACLLTYLDASVNSCSEPTPVNSPSDHSPHALSPPLSPLLLALSRMLHQRESAPARVPTPTLAHTPIISA